MSLNNYVLVKELKNGRYKVVELDADTNYQFGKAIKCSSLREAVKVAINIESEYGIHFNLKDEVINKKQVMSDKKVHI